MTTTAAIKNMIIAVEAEAEATWKIVETAGRDVAAKNAASDRYSFLAAMHDSLTATLKGFGSGVTIDTMIHEAKAALLDAEFEVKQAARALEIAQAADRVTGEDRRRVAKADAYLIETRGRLAGVMRVAGN